AGENLRRALEWLPMGRKLVTVKSDCDLAEHVPGWPALESLALKPVDREALLEFYTRYGFKTWKRELEEALGTTTSAPAAPTVLDNATPMLAQQPINRSYTTILTPEELELWADKVESAPLAALDTETDSLDAMAAQI